MRKKFFVCLCLVFLCVLMPRVLFAAVEITEIMYDLKDTPDTDHEWIEIHNSGSASVDISKYKFNDGSNHVLNAPPENGGQGSLVLAADGYAILAAKADLFMVDHAGFSGSVIDTSMSLNNSGDTLKIIDDTGAVADTATYGSDQGGNGDGKSLQKKGSEWIAAEPTPAGATTGTSSNTNAGTTTTTTPTGGTVSTQSTVALKPYVPPQMSASVVVPEYATVGLPIKVATKVTGLSGEPVGYGIFRWSMGDGMERETTDNREPFVYAYAYTGEYVLIFEHYAHKDAFEPDVRARLLVSVIAPKTVIKEIRQDGAVVLENKSDYEVDLSKWVMTASSGITFTIPKSTFILPNHELVFGPAHTGFVGSQSKDAVRLAAAGAAGGVTLSLPTGEIQSVFPPVPVETFTAISGMAAALPSAMQAVAHTPPPVHAVSGTVSIPSATLTANAIGAETGVADTSHTQPPSRGMLQVLLFSGLSIAAVGGAIAVRRMQRAKTDSSIASESVKADDFEIID